MEHSVRFRDLTDHEAILAVLEADMVIDDLSELLPGLFDRCAASDVDVEKA